MGSCCRCVVLEITHWKLLFEGDTILPPIWGTWLSIGEHYLQNKYTISAFLVQSLMGNLQDAVKSLNSQICCTNSSTHWFLWHVYFPKPSSSKAFIISQPVTIHLSFLLSFSLSLANNLITSLLANTIAFSPQVSIRLFSPWIWITNNIQLDPEQLFPANI